ncbi:hypothetical protein QTG54_008107 [Skeletonema marinoi]|uniref:Uncharacterized protein n=1 Tax=Skeletonema marinoi TaxID=267567 RepID=A0AAD8Y9D2_9STRA|nr:hypothetical protein QTG54_008107 [Skeletonema marinoi]
MSPAISMSKARSRIEDRGSNIARITMLASATDSSKRRRLLGDASPDDFISCLLSVLPGGVLTHVANYLDAPSRLFFAAALTNQNTAASDERNSVIIGNEWTTLDFGGIEEDLAARLSDGDISAVLQCIDAVNKVKKLKLTNCINITGVGLEPLRGSTIIEQIDLSLVGKHQSPILKPNPSISCEIVLPILDSIIEREGCWLSHVQFPSVWHWGGGEIIQFEQFRMRYNEMLDNRGVGCVKCNGNLPPEDLSWIGERNLQNYTCYECLKYFCSRCTNDDGEGMLGYCNTCEKMYCQDCEETKRCSCCGYLFCVSCNPFTECSGSGCDIDICKECIASDEGHQKCYKCEGPFCEVNCEDKISAHCDSCKKDCCNACHAAYHQNDWPYCTDCGDRFCDDCNEKKGTDAIQICDGCDTICCGDCRFSMCKEEESNEKCGGCFQLAGPLLLEEVKKVQKENTEVKAENKTLKDQIGGLKDYNNFLKEQLRWAQVKEVSRK